jgi:predicted nucleic acid-binding protein
MADKKLMVDSTILIYYFRKTDKANSKLIAHFRNYEHLYISSITEFEVVNGATKAHLQFWDGMLVRFTITEKIKWLLIKLFRNAFTKNQKEFFPHHSVWYDLVDV